jgi:hypothetical protein
LLKECGRKQERALCSRRQMVSRRADPSVPPIHARWVPKRWPLSARVDPRRPGHRSRPVASTCARRELASSPKELTLAMSTQEIFESHFQNRQLSRPTKARARCPHRHGNPLTMADIALGYKDGSADEILYGVVRPRPVHVPRIHHPGNGNISLTDAPPTPSLRPHRPTRTGSASRTCPVAPASGGPSPRTTRTARRWSSP